MNNKEIVSWLDRFEPIGLNCETAFVLQHNGSKRGGLFWWVFIPAEDLIRVLDQRFQDFFSFDNLRPHDVDMVIDQRYNCRFHSAMISDETREFCLPTPKLEALHRIERARIDKDVEEFRVRLETGHLTCILKDKSLEDDIVHRVCESIDRFSKTTTNTILAVSEPRNEDDRPGTVTTMSPRIRRGFVSAMAPIAASNTGKYDEWRDILISASELIGAVPPQQSSTIVINDP